MNTSHRVPGITRNSGWTAVRAEMERQSTKPQTDTHKSLRVAA